MDIVTATQKLNDHGSSAHAAAEVEDALEGLEGYGKDPVSQAVSFALCYDLVPASHQESRENYPEGFVPLFESQGRVFPPYIRTVPEGTLGIWATIAEGITAPVVAARLHDLLWTRRRGEQPFQHALKAVDAYLAAAATPGCPDYCVNQYFERSLELAALLNARDATHRIADGVAKALRAALEEETFRPECLEYLRFLAVVAAEARPEDFSLLLSRTERALGDASVDTKAYFLDIHAQAGLDDGARTEIQRQKAILFRDYARTQEGMLKTFWLQKALGEATQAGSVSLANEARRLLQEHDPSDDMQEIESQISLPSREVDRLIEGIVGDDDISGALGRLGLVGPLAGRTEDATRQAGELAQQHPIRFLASRVVFHELGFPISRLATDEDKLLYEQMQVGVQHALLSAALAGHALGQIQAKYAPTTEELRDLFNQGAVKPHQADAFARGFEHYLAGQWDECVHVVLPRIEAVLRQLLQWAGGVVYHEEGGGQRGRMKTLGPVLDNLRPVMEHDWLVSLRIVLAEPLGLNLRNDYLHGLVVEPRKDHATLVLLIASYLRLLGVAESSREEDEPGRDREGAVTS